MTNLPRLVLPDKPKKSQAELYAHGMNLVDKANWLRVSRGQSILDPTESEDPFSVVAELLTTYLKDLDSMPGDKARYEVTYWTDLKKAFEEVDPVMRNRVNDIYLKRKPEVKLKTTKDRYEL